MSEGGRQRHAARAESGARDVNEAIERGRWPGEEDDAAAFRCECSALDCNQLISITPRDYEDVREHGRRFVMMPGHEDPSVELVVERRSAYVIVEKRGEAGRIAEASDPRS
jgi:hypothetical protein